MVVLAIEQVHEFVQLYLLVVRVVNLAKYGYEINLADASLAFASRLRKGRVNRSALLRFRCCVKPSLLLSVWALLPKVCAPARWTRLPLHRIPAASRLDRLCRIRCRAQLRRRCRRTGIGPPAIRRTRSQGSSSSGYTNLATVPTPTQSCTRQEARIVRVPPVRPAHMRSPYECA